MQSPSASPSVSVSFSAESPHPSFLRTVPVSFCVTTPPTSSCFTSPPAYPKVCFPGSSLLFSPLTISSTCWVLCKKWWELHLSLFFRSTVQGAGFHQHIASLQRFTPAPQRTPEVQIESSIFPLSFPSPPMFAFPHWDLKPLNQTRQLSYFFLQPLTKPHPFLLCGISAICILFSVSSSADYFSSLWNVL